MAAQYIPVSIEDFEKLFNIPSKKNPNERAFYLHQPPGQEAFYACKLKENNAGTLYLYIYTSVKSGCMVSRSVGKDAIRLATVWVDCGVFSVPLDKSARVYRAGGVGSVAGDVVQRTFDRAKELALDTVQSVEWCPKCGRPMVLRKGSNGEFYGCVGFSKVGCRGSKSHRIYS